MTTTSKPLASRRSETSRLAILDAALALCRDQGYAKVTIEAIAARAGVGKQTIYRWWPSKGAVVLDAFERVAAEIPVPDTGDVLADMRTFLTNVVTLFTDDNFGPHLGALIGEAQHDPAVRTALLEQYLKPRRAAVAEPPQARPAARTTPRRTRSHGRAGGHFRRPVSPAAAAQRPPRPGIRALRRRNSPRRLLRPANHRQQPPPGNATSAGVTPSRSNAKPPFTRG